MLAKPVKTGDAKLLGPLTWQPVALKMFDTSELAARLILMFFYKFFREVNVCTMRWILM